MAKKNAEKLEMIPAGENKNALAIFGENKSAEGFERLNLPVMFKPSEWPIGQTAVCEVVKIVDSPVSTVKGKLLWLKSAANGQEFTFPCTGTIRNALAAGLEGDKLDSKLNSYVGKTIALTREPDKTSAKYKKNMFMFDVRLKK